MERNPYQCPGCEAPFDTDVELLNYHQNHDQAEEHQQHRLPVSCQYCVYSVCNECFTGWFDEWRAVHLKETPPKVLKIPCPGCGNEQGFDPLKPNICPFACLLLGKQQQQQEAHSTRNKQGSSSQEKKRSAETKVAKGSSSGAAVKSSSVLVTPPRVAASSSNNRTKRIIKQEEIESAPQQSNQGDKEKPQPTRPPAKRKANDTAAASQSAAKKPAAVKARKSSTPSTPKASGSSHRTQVTGWVEDMHTWLLQVDQCSASNARSVTSKVRKLVSGEGISYTNWPDGVTFRQGQPIDDLFTTNFDQMLDQAKAFEKMYGEDKGHGWLMRHPIAKLGKYQKYLMETKEDSSKPPATTTTRTNSEDEYPQPVNRNRNDDQGSGDGAGVYKSPAVAVAAPAAADGVHPVFPTGTEVYKFFPGYGWYFGKIESYIPQDGCYGIRYEDNDEELLHHNDVAPLVEAAKKERDGGKM